MAALGSQSIASSYEQLLHVDADGGGNSTTLVNVKDGDNGTTFALQLASDNIKVGGSSDLDGAVTINESSADVDFRVESNGDANMLFVDGGNDKVGISTNAPSAKIHIDNDTDQFAMFVDSDYRENTRFHSTESNQGTRVIITNGSITSDAGFGFNVGNGGDNKMEIGTSTSAGSVTGLMTITSAGLVGIGDEANGNMTQGLTINQGAADNEILAFKSSDSDHSMTGRTETDTYATFGKYHGTGGGLEIHGYTDSDAAAGNALALAGSLGEAADTTKSTSGLGIVAIQSSIHDGSTGKTVAGSDQNLFVVQNDGTTRFIFDAEGSFHADVESTTFDAYDDAQLVRAYDLSHGKGMIESKFDQFIDYNHETLADLKLVGREEDGTPNRMVNVTGMQHLHNGAIWQQYTEMQKMKELMYDTMVEVIGKEKADQKLTDHDIQLLDNKTLLN